jgi:hypothetical protein
MRGNSWLAANRLASQEGLCCMEYVSKYRSCADRVFYADWRTEMTNSTLTFRSFASAPKNRQYVLHCTSPCSVYTGSQARCWSYWFSYVMNSLVVCSLACKPAMVWDDPGNLWGASGSDFINTNQKEILSGKLFAVTLSPWSLQLSK